MYKNNIPISDLVRCIKDTNSYNAFENSGLTINTGYNDFTSSLVEIPSNLNYEYANVDISTYSIATWVDSNSGFSSLPSWCTKIRAVLIGGGGAGAQGEFSYNSQINNHQNGAGQISNQHNNDNQDIFVGQSGGGGGGGGFVFLNTTNASQMSVQCGIGGQANGASGTATVLVVNGSNVAVALGGGGASLVGGGGGGGTQGGSTVASGGGGSAVPAVTSAGVVGGGVPGGQQYINSGALKSYGIGGGGTSASYYTTQRTYTGQGQPQDWNYNFPSGITYQPGNDGYYRIYFLTN